jgi:hypothetical protein
MISRSMGLLRHYTKGVSRAKECFLTQKKKYEVLRSNRNARAEEDTRDMKMGKEIFFPLCMHVCMHAISLARKVPHRTARDAFELLELLELLALFALFAMLFRPVRIHLLSARANGIRYTYIGIQLLYNCYTTGIQLLYNCYTRMNGGGVDRLSVGRHSRAT